MAPSRLEGTLLGGKSPRVYEPRSPRFPLGKAEVEKIIDLQLQNLRRTLAEKKIQIELTAKAHDLLFQQGYDPQFGARPLKRAIQRLIQDPLAMKLLDGEIAPGETLTVDADPKRGEMTFARATVKATRS
jgi:ATP-dependent Clp protease ATP-binding subunit ClpB